MYVCKDGLFFYFYSFYFKETWNQFSEKSHSLFGEVADQGYKEFGKQHVGLKNEPFLHIYNLVYHPWS